MFYLVFEEEFTKTLGKLTSPPPVTHASVLQTFSTYLGVTFFRKTNIAYPLKCTRSCAYQGVRDVSLSERFAYVLNG